MNYYFFSRFALNSSTKHSSRGFTLIEFIAVIVITSTLAVTAVVRFSDSGIQLIRAKKDIVAALHHARQLALMRAENDMAIVAITGPNSIDIQESSTSINFADASYPLTFSPGISVTQGQGRLTYDQLGSTTPSVIEITDGTSIQRITITGGGYVY